jgi:hypothetical protein
MNPQQIEATLNKAQSLLDGLRSTWRRRDIEEMAQDAEALQQTMGTLLADLKDGR